MLVSTRGIVVHQADYSETSLIVKIYTEHFGLQSYIVKGVRKKGSKIKRNLFGPLSIVELVAYKKENSGLHMIRDVSCFQQFNQIATDVVKSSIVLFMNELLYRSVHDEMPDQKLYGFLFDSIQKLEEMQVNLAGFPNIFALQLASFLGFGPHNNHSETNGFFNMIEGDFCEVQPEHAHCIPPPLSSAWAKLLVLHPGDNDGVEASDRNLLMSKILEYYRLHLPAFGEMKSPQILSTILRD